MVFNIHARNMKYFFLRLKYNTFPLIISVSSTMFGDLKQTGTFENISYLGTN